MFVLLEARTRYGGRVMAYNRDTHCKVDLGAQIIMGIIGNPIITLAKQLPVTLIPISPKCPIFDQNGRIC